MIGNNYHISFCTAIRNRLCHLRETLPQNILKNKDYDHLQFVILDYNSSDGLEEWMAQEMAGFIETGKVVYFRTRDPGLFHRTHCMNLLFDLADGDILCNIDADNFAGEQFAGFVNDAFQPGTPVFLATNDDSARVDNDVLGRICVRKSDFLSVGGYDENMEGHGFEDYDLINRLSRSGLKKIVIRKPEFLHAISHDNKLRIMEEKGYHDFHKLLIRYLDPARSELVALLKDGIAQRGTLVDRKSLKASVIGPDSRKPAEYNYFLQETDWENGSWTEAGSKIVLSFSTIGQLVLLESKKGYLLHNAKRYYPLKDEGNIFEFILFQSQMANRHKMSANLTMGLATKKSPGSKIGKVFKNFNDHSPHLYFYYE
jgi:hypothetical protein